MFKKVPKIITIHRCIQQFIVANIALGQSFPGQHASAHRSHVIRIPVLLQCQRNIFSSSAGGIYVLFKVLCRLSRCTAHASFCLRTKIGVGPRSQTKAVRFLHKVVGVSKYITALCHVLNYLAVPNLIVAELMHYHWCDPLHRVVLLRCELKLIYWPI